MDQCGIELLVFPDRLGIRCALSVVGFGTHLELAHLLVADGVARSQDEIGGDKVFCVERVGVRFVWR